jgi:CheY-like chemotaxis protein/HPt (histidine-containing phosphotransfer) domain-containing protein
MDEMVQQFMLEADDLLEEAEVALLDYEKNHENFMSHFNEVFRAFHSLKGGSGMLGLEKFSTHVHKVENSLIEIKKTNTFTQHQIDYFLAVIDYTKINKPNLVDEFNYISNTDLLEDKIPKEKLIPEKKKEILVKVAPERNIVSETYEVENIETTDVFIVDDEEDILEILTETLSNVGFQVKAFNNPKKLVQNIKDGGHPDLIISDIKMPEMSGIELLKNVNKVRPHIPLMIVSGFITKETCLEALSNGCSGILEKPFEEEDLLRQATFASKRYKAFRLLNRSVDLLVHKFSEFDEFLGEKFSSDVQQNFRKDLKNLLETKKILMRTSYEKK